MKLTVSKFYKYCKDLLNGDTQLTHPGEVFLAWIAKMNFEYEQTDAEESSIQTVQVDYIDISGYMLSTE